MKKIPILLGGLLLALFSSAPAFADSFTFTLSIYCQQNTTANCAGQGSNQFYTADPLTLTATSNGNGKYTVTGVSGIINEGSGGSAGSNLPTAVTSAIATNGFQGNDNILLGAGTSSTYFDSNGLSILLADGSKIQIYGSGVGGTSSESFQEGAAYGGEHNLQSGLLVLSGPTAVTNPTGPPSITPTGVTPEPSSIFLLGTGLLSVAGAARRRYSL